MPSLILILIHGGLGWTPWGFGGWDACMQIPRRAEGRGSQSPLGGRVYGCYGMGPAAAADDQGVITREAQSSRSGIGLMAPSARPR